MNSQGEERPHRCQGPRASAGRGVGSRGVWRDAADSAPAPLRGRARPVRAACRRSGAVGGRGAALRPTCPGSPSSWLLSGDESFARRALEELRADRPTGSKGSSRYVRYLNRSMAFDWLYGYAGFDAALKDAVAADLVAGAEQMLALPSLQDPAQASYHNHTARELALAVFSLAAVEGHPSVESRAGAAARAGLAGVRQPPRADRARRTRTAAYHESTDYMRITWAPLAMMAEVRRTATGQDPAARWSVFRNMGTTYLYKVLPDGSEARDDDDEFPHLDSRDNVVLGYAVHRFKDPYAAWMLRQRAWLPAEWANPVLRVPVEATPRSCRAIPRTTTESELPRHRHFRGVGHLVLRDGWGEDSTWIQLACGPYFAKHDHLDARAPRRLPQGLPGDRRRRRLHRHREPALPEPLPADASPTTPMLVYQPGETFFWGENKWPAANDGGQRMDSSRFWNSVRSLEDWRAHAGPLGPLPSSSPWPRSRRTATRAPTRPAPTSPSKLESLHARDRPPARAERPRRPRPRAREGPVLPQGLAAARRERADRSWPAARRARASATAGRATARRPLVTLRGRRRAGSASTPSCRASGRWSCAAAPGSSSGRRATSAGAPGARGRTGPSTRPRAGPLPEDPYLLKMWKTFWDGIDRLSPSNRRAVVPGAWRMEVSPGSRRRGGRLPARPRDRRPRGDARPAGRGDRRASASPGRRSRATPSSSSQR